MGLNLIRSNKTDNTGHWRREGNGEEGGPGRLRADVSKSVNNHPFSLSYHLPFHRFEWLYGSTSNFYLKRSWHKLICDLHRNLPYQIYAKLFQHFSPLVMLKFAWSVVQEHPPDNMFLFAHSWKKLVAQSHFVWQANGSPTLQQALGLSLGLHTFSLQMVRYMRLLSLTDMIELWSSQFCSPQ